MGVGPCVGAWLPRGARSHQLQIAPQLGVELHASLHDYMLSMTWVCTGLVYDVTTAVRSYVQPLCCVQKTVFPCSCLPPQDLTLFPPSLPQ